MTVARATPEEPLKRSNEKVNVSGHDYCKYYQNVIVFVFFWSERESRTNAAVPPPKGIDTSHRMSVLMPS
jgi:hypothetical protein